MILNVDLHDGELDLILQGLDALIDADMSEASYHRHNLLNGDIELAEQLEERVTASQMLYQKIKARVQYMRGV